MTNQTVIEIFLNHCSIERGLSKNTIAAYRRDLGKFTDFLDVNGVNLSEVSATHLTNFIAHLRSSSLSESSLARHVVAIRSLYTFLSKDQGIVNVAKEMYPPKIPKRLPKALSIEDIDKLISANSDDPSGIRNRALIEMLYATGARVSEIIQLNVGDVSRSDG
ncbi:MAG: site-specific integrase, partial [Actinomycetota bacterium]